MGWSLPFWLHHQHHSNNEKFATVNAKLIMKILRDLQLQFCKVLSFWMMNVKPTCATIAVIKNWPVWEKYGNRKVVSLFHSFDSQTVTSLMRPYMTPSLDLIFRQKNKSRKFSKFGWTDVFSNFISKWRKFTPRIITWLNWVHRFGWKRRGCTKTYGSIEQAGNQGWKWNKGPV